VGGIEGDVEGLSELGGLEAIGCQELFHRKKRKLDNFEVLITDYGDLSRTSWEYSLFWVFWTPTLL